MSRSSFSFRSFLFGALMVALAAGSAPPLRAQTSNQILNFQGRLFDGGGLPQNGPFNFTFAIYTIPTGGAPVFSETQTVTANNGYYNAQIGSVGGIPASVFTNADLYLGVTVALDGEMAPRSRLTSSAFAFNAALLGGVAPAGYALFAPAAAQTDASTNPTLFFNKTAGSGNMLTLQKNGADKLTLSNAANTLTFADPAGGNDKVIRATLNSLNLEADTSVRVMLDNDNNSTTSLFAVRANNAATDLFTVSETGNATVLNQAELRLGELAVNGTNYSGFRSAAAMGANVTYTLPSADGSAGQVLSTNGAGTLSWTAGGGGSGTVTSVSAGTPGAQTGTSGLTFSVNPITTTGSISIATAGVSNAMLANSSITVSAGTGLTGGSTVSLGGTTSLALSVPVSIANGGTGGTTVGPAGTVAYSNGTGYVFTAAGVAGSGVLISAGSATPYWGNIITGSVNPQWSVTTSSTTANATAVLGTASDAAAVVYGVTGTTPSTANNAAGVRGTATALTGGTNGVRGESASDAGAGVLGLATTAGGAGVVGASQAAGAAGTFSIGVLGVADAAETNIGVEGETSTDSGAGLAAGVRGFAGGTSDGAVGCVGVNASTVTTGFQIGLAGVCNVAAVGATHIGVYGFTGGGTANFSGYFDDNQEFKISDWGTTTPTRTVDGSIATATVGGVNRLYIRTGTTDRFISTDGAGDYSEFFGTSDASLAIGEVVAIDPDLANGVRRARPSDLDRLTGIVSQYGTRNNDDSRGERASDPGYVNVALVGQVPVLVTAENGPIRPGDPLTLSPRWRGRAVRATGPAPVIGYALTHFPYVPGEVTWPDNVDGSEADCLAGDHVMCLVQPGAYSASAPASEGEIPEAQPTYRNVQDQRAREIAQRIESERAARPKPRVPAAIPPVDAERAR